MENYEKHRLAVDGEPICGTCDSFNYLAGVCDNIDTCIIHTSNLHTCRYHNQSIVIIDHMNLLKP